eukprot:20801-Prymnesium_polylepis.1
MLEPRRAVVSCQPTKTIPARRQMDVIQQVVIGTARFKECLERPRVLDEASEKCRARCRACMATAAATTAGATLGALGTLGTLGALGALGALTAVAFTGAVTCAQHEGS